jgi:hypothetical protein
VSTTESETPVPGTGEIKETPTPVADPSAETLNADTSQSGPPESVPYARFKEVNDRLTKLKPYAQLEDIGYDPDSLGQLAAFEQSYVQDEVGTLQTLVKKSEVLTDEQKEGMIAALEGNIDADEVERMSTTPPSEEEIPSWGKPLIEERETRQQQKAQEDANKFLEGIMTKWDEADVADKSVPTPKSVKLAFIAANAPHATSVDQLIGVCRQLTKEYETSILTGAVTPASGGLSGSLPKAVPGSGVPVPTPTPLKDLKSATAAAQSAIEAGLLPPVGRR